MFKAKPTSKTRAYAALVAAAPLLFAAASQAQDSSSPAADPPALVARIGYTQGSVSFMAAGATDWAAGENNYPMTSGDRLYCDQNSQAEIGVGSTDIRLWQSTDVTLTNLTDQYEQIGLAAGSIRVRIYGIDPGSTVEVDTPNGSAVITQPGDYRFDVFSGDGGSDAVVNAGSIQITGPQGLNQEVDAGQAVQMTGSNPIQLTSLNLPPFDALDQWSIQRDHEVLNSQAAQYVSPETPGATDLDAAGTWTPSPDYGPVWYPTTVAYGWQPYSVGHWAYVAPWGYTWIDAAPWGYAPFHYGRWAFIGGRWGWCPGPRAVVPVYSPALVAFVGGPGIAIGIGGVGVAAWFPLGVGEPFVPWYRASPAYARQVNVTNVNITNIHNTTIVNNYNTFITNTRTVNNVSQINTANIQYAHRAQVTAVPANAMSSGRPVATSAVKLTPALQQQLAAAPVHAAPSAPAPTHSLLPARPNVPAPAARPTLVTPHGLAPATPGANPSKMAVANLPRPKPYTALPKPAPGAVAGRPATAQPSSVRTNTLSAPATRPAPPNHPNTNPTEERPASTPQNENHPPARPAYREPNPAAPRPAESAPQNQYHPPAQPQHNPPPQRPAAKPPQPKPAPKPKPEKKEQPK